MSFIINPYAHNAEALIGPNTGMVLATHKLKAMMVEHSVALTDVANDGDAVGLVYDLTVNGMIIRQDTAANRPILGSDGTRNSYLTFDGTNDNLPIRSSLSFFNTFWESVPRGTILIWFRMNGGDGVTQAIMSNTDYSVTANDAGFQILRNNSNVIIARAATDQSGTGFRWTYTSTATVVAADGWRGMIVSINGTDASAGRFILMNSAGTILEDQTFTVSAGSTINAQTITYIGARADATTPDLFLNGDISAIIVENFPVSDSLIDQFRNYNPPKDSSEFTPILQSLIDINNSAYVFSDAAGTTPVVANDPVRIIRNNIIGNFNTTPTFGALRRNRSSASSGASPIYRTNVLNGFPAIEFDGSDDLFTFLNPLFEEQGGKWTFFIVAENQDNTFGSHLMRGENYMVITGASYVGGLTSPYLAFHPDNVGESGGVEGKNTGSNGPKLFAMRRNGSAFACWNGNKTKTTSTITSLFTIVDQGLAHAVTGSDWNFDGYLFYEAKYNGVMTDAEVEAEIDRLNARFGI